MNEIGIINRPKVISKKYYRDKNKFAQIPHYKGMYYNSDNTFTEFKKPNTIGICVEQTLDELTICEVTETLFKGSWDECLNYCKNKFENGYIPSFSELIRANENNYIKTQSVLVWINNNHTSNYARGLYLTKESAFSNVCYSNRTNYHSVLAFCKIKY